MSTNKRTVRAAARRATAFLSARGGNVGIIFGFAMMPILATMGSAVDFAKSASLRSALQQATDSAVLTVAGKLTSSTALADAQNQAQSYINANPATKAATVTTATISTDFTSFCATAQVGFSTSFMKLFGVSTLTRTVTSCARTSGGVDSNTTYEIALVLDNSGSMGESTNGTTKIAALQSAAKNFAATMFSQAPGKVKISVVPFASGVVAVDPTVSANRTQSWIDTGAKSSQHWTIFGGASSAAAAGFTNRFDVFNALKAQNSSWDWGGCFDPQPYPYNVNDTPPSSAKPDTLLVPFLAPDEPSNGNYYNNYLSDTGGSCATAPTDDWSKIARACKYTAPANSNTTGSCSRRGGGSTMSYAYGPNGLCPNYTTQMLLQLTATQTDVTNKLNQLVANGDTNLHEGFMWGWRSISPNAPFASGRAYNTTNNRKIVVFMTDGYNNWVNAPGTVGGSFYESPGYYSFNGAKNVHLPDGGSGDKVDYQTQLAAANGSSSSSFYGNSRNALDELTREACANAKAQGIEIFTIGFSIPADPIDTQGLTLLQACATNSAHYFAATDVSSFVSAFTQIGTALSHLHLTK